MRPPRLPAELRLAVLQRIGPDTLAEVLGGIAARALAGDEQAAALLWDLLAREMGSGLGADGFACDLERNETQ